MKKLLLILFLCTISFEAKSNWKQIFQDYFINVDSIKPFGKSVTWKGLINKEMPDSNAKSSSMLMMGKCDDLIINFVLREDYAQPLGKGEIVLTKELSTKWEKLSKNDKGLSYNQLKYVCNKIINAELDFNWQKISELDNLKAFVDLKYMHKPTESFFYYILVDGEVLNSENVCIADEKPFSSIAYMEGNCKTNKLKMHTHSGFSQKMGKGKRLCELPNIKEGIFSEDLLYRSICKQEDR